MPYQHATLADLREQLAARLDDPDSVHWVTGELDAAVRESLRVFNCLTGHFRDRGVLSTSSDVAFYSLTSGLQNSSLEELRAQTVRDRELVTEIQYHLLEPATPGSWSGTDQFTLGQIVAALQRRRDQFLAETACVVSQQTVAVDTTGRVELDDDIVSVRRCLFVDSTGAAYPLRPSDERTAGALLRDINTPGDPRGFSVVAASPLTLQMLPVPANTGELRLLVVRTGTPLDTTSNSNAGTLIGLPDDLVWAVKYGALADLLSADASDDPTRADECERLYRLGVQLAQRLPVVLTVAINGRSVLPGALTQTDLLRRGWDVQETSTPDTVSIAALDLIAATPVPDGQHTLLLDVVRTAIIPQAATDYIQCGREHLELLLGYAYHILTFKHGGAEHQSTQPLAQQFFEQSAAYSYRSRAVSSLLDQMRMISSLDLRHQPVERQPNPQYAADAESDDIRSERNARRRRVTST